MKWGVSYYPEWTPRSEWARDLDRMNQAGLTVLRILDFGWSAIEPREGDYRWDWLDHFLELVADRDMQVVMCTPTATPPPWLAQQYPQVMIELRTGQRRPFGSRRDVDLCSPIYRDYCAEIAQRMADRYGHHATVLGWQIDNEIVGPELAPPESHSPDANWRFRRWLRERYETIDALNEAWFTIFWNQAFSDWGEVTTPRHDRVTRGWAVDHARFFSDMIIEYTKVQYDVIRPRIADHQWITTNSTAMMDRGIDHGELHNRLDVAGWDAYPGAASAGHGHPMAFTALVCDWLRASTRKPVKVLETRVTPGEPGTKLFPMLHHHGVDTVLLWHWREHRGNVEQRSQVICDWAGEPYPDHLERVKQAVESTRNLPALPDELPPKRVALIFSLDNYRVHMHKDPYDRSKLNYLDTLIAMYEPLWEAGIEMDVVPPDADLSGYELVAAPSLRLLDEADAKRITDYVAQGGALLASAKSAHQNTTAVFYPQPLSPLADVLGVTLREDARPPETPLTIQLADGTTVDAVAWPEKWETTDGEVLGHFASGPLDGRPAVLKRRFGQGHVLYLAAPSAPAITALLPEWLKHIPGLDTLIA